MPNVIAAVQRMLEYQMQQEEEEDPDEEPEFEEIPDLDDEDLTDTINNRKETTEEQL